MQRLTWIWGTAWAVVVAGAACQDLGQPPGAGREEIRREVSFEPDCASDSVPPVVRIRIPGGGLGPADVTLFRGALTQRDLRDIRANNMGKALQARQIGLLSWQRDDGLEAAPSIKLDLGAQYTVAAAQLGWSRSFRVMESDTEPYLTRVWPPVESSGPFSAAIWCVAEPTTGDVRSQARRFAFWPGPVNGSLTLGALGGMGEGCLSWTPDDGYQTGPLMPPPEVQVGDGSWVRLDPSPLQGKALTESSSSAPCRDSAAFGPICARVQDDRIVLLSRGDSVWVAVSVLGLRWTGIVSANRQATLRPVPPNTALVVQAMSVDMAGKSSRWSSEVQTMSVQPHVVVNELMANPRGKEPDQEWVELYNDGVESVQLVGWTLEDVGGTLVLPEHELLPGTFALVVNESYQQDAWGDRPATQGTQLIRVARLGNDGLSNGGEPLRLRNPSGQGMSAVPPISSPKQSMSVARMAPEAQDDLPSAFYLSGDGGTPGAPNTP